MRSVKYWGAQCPDKSSTSSPRWVAWPRAQFVSARRPQRIINGAPRLRSRATSTANAVSRGASDARARRKRAIHSRSQNPSPSSPPTPRGRPTPPRAKRSRPRRRRRRAQQMRRPRLRRRRRAAARLRRRTSRAATPQPSSTRSSTPAFPRAPTRSLKCTLEGGGVGAAVRGVDSRAARALTFLPLSRAPRQHALRDALCRLWLYRARADAARNHALSLALSGRGDRGRPAFAI